MLIFIHRTHKWVLPHLSFVYEIHFLFKKKDWTPLCECWFAELIFSPSLEWKHKRIEFMMKKIYIHPRYMELCVCITDYDDMHKRELKDFWQLFCVLRDDIHFRNNIPWTDETKKINVFNVRVDNCMRSERKWHRRIAAFRELQYGVIILVCVIPVVFCTTVSSQVC